VLVIAVVVVVVAAVGGYEWYRSAPPAEPWYELGSPGSASNGGAPIYAGCNNTPLVSGSGWPGPPVKVTLAWYGSTGLTPSQTQYPVNASHEFAGRAPPIDPANVSGVYWLLVSDTYLDQNGVPFNAVALPLGQVCP